MSEIRLSVGVGVGINGKEAQENFIGVLYLVLGAGYRMQTIVKTF